MVNTYLVILVLLQEGIGTYLYCLENCTEHPTYAQIWSEPMTGRYLSDDREATSAGHATDVT